MMQKSAAILLLLLFTVPACADGGVTDRYRIGVTYGLGNIKTAEKPYHTFNHNWGMALGLNGRRGCLTFSLLSQKNYSDSAATGHFGFFSSKDGAATAFHSLRAGFDLDYRLIKSGRWSPTIGVGLGYLIWKYIEPVGDTVVQAVGEHDNRVDFSATEFYLSGALGAEIAISKRLAVNLKASVDYLAGWGTSFADSIDSRRGRTLMRVGLTLSYGFGGGFSSRPSEEWWPSTPSWTRQREQVSPGREEDDADGDGIINSFDRCPGTPPGAIVDSYGCATDEDNDGIVDGLDDCPRTPRAAAGFVDIFGCPVDSDFDGVPDYLDSCRFSQVGVIVGENGCPLDSDGDGVKDGLDDCPGTPPGIEVDERGCMDVAFLRDTMRINIDYPPGSFEIDMRTRDRLRPLINKLKILADVNILVLGFTDNVGAAEANQSLSQKRANRMRDWLVSEGIATDRITAIGKGETNFIASNQTAEGRALNRRIELIFSR